MERNGGKALPVAACLLIILFSSVCFAAPPQKSLSPEKRFESSLGLKEIRLIPGTFFPQFTRGKGLPLVIKTEKRCNFGDFDAMMVEASRSKDAKLIFSLEPVLPNDESFAPVFQDISRANEIAGNGYPTLVPVPPHEKAYLAGLYICKDSANTHSCRKKPVKDIGAIIRENSTAAAGVPVADDKIYFFKPVLIDGDRAFFPQRALSDEKYKEFVKYLKEKTEAGGRAEEEVKRVAELGRVLGSLPLETETGREAVIRLPRIDPAKCGTAGIRKK